MLDINEFSNCAHQGKEVDLNAFCEYVNSFNNVVIWGAGNLGTAVGKKFIDLGINISVYWDTCYKDIVMKNGIKVIEPFSGEFEKDETLVIYCIANLAVGSTIFLQLEERKWSHVIKGNDILQGILCPLNENTIIDSGKCNSMNICSVCSCERLVNLIKNKVKKEKLLQEEEVLFRDRIHIIINNFCNLKCKYCSYYMNSYPKELKRNVPIERICKDIDAILGALDVVGAVNVFGGETFLHPDTSKIINKILEHDNFGAIIPSTNGVGNIKKEQLEGFENPRVRLAFSNYKGCLTEAQDKKFHENIDFALSLGINATWQNYMPTWAIPVTFEDKHLPIEKLREKKKSCEFQYIYVFDGKIYPCILSYVLHTLGIANYPEEYIDIDSMKSPEELREKIIEYSKRDHFRTCSHCESTGPTITNKAGEQGFDPRYSLDRYLSNNKCGDGEKNNE